MFDGIINVDGVALVVEPQNCLLITSQRTDRFSHTGETSIAVGILLGKDRDLVRPQSLHLHQIVYNGAGLFSVAGPIIENISVWRVASEQPGAGERAEKQHLALKSIGQRDGCSRRAHVADHSENLVIFVEPLHCFGSPSWLVTVVTRNEPKLPAVHSATRIDCIKRGFDADLHILAEFFGSTAEWRGNSKSNFAVGYTANRASCGV